MQYRFKGFSRQGAKMLNQALIIAGEMGQTQAGTGHILLAILRGEAKIDPELTMHDFRVVEGERRINLIFDVVVPFGYSEEKKDELKTRIQTGLKARDKRYCPVVTMEHKMTL